MATDALDTWDRATEDAILAAPPRNDGASQSLRYIVALKRRVEALEARVAELEAHR